MSTLKVDGIRSNSASSDAITLASDGTCTANITSVNSVVMPNSGHLSNRNKIYNGKMDVDQRNNGSSTNIEGNSTKYHIDRWAVDGASLDELSAGVQQVAEAPDGFIHSLKITTNTPESAIASGELVYLSQKLEGQDLQDLGYNTSSVKAVTMSFWVRSSITGTYGFSIYRDESGTDRIINKTYTIDTANTWEKKTITIAGDTGRGLGGGTSARWWNVWHLASGSTFDSATASSWEDYTSAKWAGGHAQDGVITTNGATWQITGVQLETGSVATDFEHRPYGDELLRCQRYFCKAAEKGGSDHSAGMGANYNGSNGYIHVRFPVTMRTSPTLDQVTGTNYYRLFSNGGYETFDSFNSIDTATVTPQCAEVLKSGISITAGAANFVRYQHSEAEIRFSAEL